MIDLPLFETKFWNFKMSWQYASNFPIEIWRSLNNQSIKHWRCSHWYCANRRNDKHGLSLPPFFILCLQNHCTEITLVFSSVSRELSTTRKGIKEYPVCNGLEWRSLIQHLIQVGVHALCKPSKTCHDCVCNTEQFVHYICSGKKNDIAHRTPQTCHSITH